MRRRDSERIYQAQRAGIVARLTQNERVDERVAEALVSAWEHEAESRAVARSGHAFWDAGWDWIAEQRKDPRTRRLG